MKLYILVILIVAAGIVSSSSCGRKTPEPLTVPADTLAMPAGGITERQAFDRGRADGIEMMRECGTDTVKLRRALLHAHSCASAYGLQIGQKAMVDYRAGLRAAITEQSPSVADIIFK